jgi:hypothetical protein
MGKLLYRYVEASMKFGGGGLGPDGVPIRYGHGDIAGATSPELNNPLRNRFAGQRQQSTAGLYKFANPVDPPIA